MRVVLRIAAAVSFCVCGLATPSPARADGDPAAVIVALIDAGSHPDLRWPSFAAHQDQLRQIYEPRAFAPFWVRDGQPTAQATEVIASLATADAKGLDVSDYDAAHLAAAAEQLRANRQASADEIGRFDVAVTVSVMRFVSDSATGKIKPHELGYGIEPDPNRIDLLTVVPELATEPNPGQHIASLDPPLPVYGRLREALVRYRELAARNDLPPVPNLPKLRPGGSDPGVRALRAWLTAYRDLPADAAVPKNASHYDPALVAAVKHFQRRHGLEPDGVIGAGTLQALKVPPTQRVRQIELAMERLRWLPLQTPERFVVINIPEFRLRGFEDAEPVPRVDMNVVVGSSADKTETPVLYADMRYLIFRPYWLVPSSIAKKEILPKADRDPSYLNRQNMEVVNGRLRQRPGPTNSLGLLKFIFPNPFHVYLHDTPSKSLFRRTRRDFSHGCIRVADAPALAEFVLDHQPGWNRQRIEDAMKRGADNHYVDLQTPLPVYVVYATAVVDPTGQVDFFDDIYGHDATLDALLARGYPYSS